MSDTPRQLESRWAADWAPDDSDSAGAATTLLRNPSALELPYRPARYVRSAVFDAERERERIIAECDEVKARADEIRASAREAGLAEAKAQAAALLNEVGGRLQRMHEDFEAEVLTTASALVAALLDADDHFYDEAMASLVGAAFASVRRDRSITIRASRRAAPWIESLREDLLPSLAKADDMTVLVDPTLDDRTIRIDTEHGSSCFSLRARLRRLRASVRRGGTAASLPVAAGDLAVSGDDAPSEGDLA